MTAVFKLALSWFCADLGLILSFVGGLLVVNLFGELRLTYHCLASVELYLQVLRIIVETQGWLPSNNLPVRRSFCLVVARSNRP